MPALDFLFGEFGLGLQVLNEHHQFLSLPHDLDKLIAVKCAIDFDNGLGRNCAGDLTPVVLKEG